MHVLVVTIVHVPTDARIHHRQIRALRQAGHRVTYAAPLSGYGLAPADVEADAVVDLPRARGRDRGRALRAARSLLRATHDADVVIVHDPDLLLVAGSADAPVIWDVHEDVAASLGDRAWVPSRLRSLVAAGARRLERRAERRHHLLLAETAYQERFSSAHAVVPNYPWLPPAPVRLGSDRVVYLGRVSRLRGAGELIEVGRQLRGEAVVDVIGPVDSDVRPALEQAARDGLLQLRGYVPNDAALRLLDGALAGLSLLHDAPNYRHSMPTKILEYQAHGLPVVATPLPLAEQVVTESGSGIVVPFGDASAVVAAVERLRSTPDLAQGFAQAGRRAAEERYSFDRVAPAFVAAVEAAARR